jgi:hypothetical protein
MSLRQLSALSMLACTLSIPGVTSAADLSVGGQIRPGGACDITLGNGGVADFGNLSRKDLYGADHMRAFPSGPLGGMPSNVTRLSRCT